MTIDAMGLDRPLSGVRVLDFSQYLSGPMCALRLADMGAEVVKIEKTAVGDQCRKLAVADQWVGDDSLLFQFINRGKKSVEADLKAPRDLDSVRELLATADVMIHNFRPGVMERIGLGYQDAKELNSGIVYGVVSGYGTEGPWRDLPGQDLLAQSRSGMLWLSGSAQDAPIPMGVSITDISAGQHLAQGVLAALFKKARTGQGGLVEVSLLASAMDVQFEQFSSFLNGGEKEHPPRSKVNGANVHATAPYGVYKTADGYISMAMASIAQLADCLSIEALHPFVDQQLAFVRRDEIKAILKDNLRTRSTSHWLSILELEGIWCAEVLDWPGLLESGALSALDVVQQVTNADGSQFFTTNCPIRFDGVVPKAGLGAPSLGADTAKYLRELPRQETEVAQ